MDPAEQLQRIYLAGFDVQTFDRFPNAVGVTKGNCIAMLQPTPTGLIMLGAPGWRMGDNIGVVVEHRGRKVFQHKQEEIDVEQVHLEELRRFQEDLGELLRPAS